MEFSPDRIFISYARSDGRAFAEAFEQRLEQEAGIHSWRDLTHIGSGDILPQVLRAIENVEHLVLILTRRAIVSDWVKREWTHARMSGRMVSPVLADPTLKRTDLPAWMRREEVYDIAEPERWEKLKLVLHGPGKVRRVPYMSGDLSDNFVPRPAEYAQLKQAVLAAGTDKAVALTTALSGAGGYGKTTLANYLCRDPDVRFEFTDGILRVEIGKERDGVIGLIVDLIEKLDPDGKRPGFQDVQTAAEDLAERIGEARLLLVIDDVWREAQLRPFLRGGPNCVRLVTTRLPHVLPPSHIPIRIDAMRDAEGLELISRHLPVADATAAQSRLATLVDRLGGWAQMLGIANGWMKQRVAAGEPLATAIEKFERRLSTRGLVGFDPKDETERNRAIRICIEASIEDLRKDEFDRFGELAVLAEDESIPLGMIESLWHEAGDLDEDEADDLIQQLNRLSLLQELNLGARTLRLHDNTMWYLRDRLGPEGCRVAHIAMIRALRARCDAKWDTLPSGDVYGWRFLIRHLRGAGEDDEADRLLTDYAWIKAKLRTRGSRDLFESYLPESEDETARLVGRAIALSVPTLASYPRELPRQVFGRIGMLAAKAAAIAAAAKQDPDFRPAPRWPGLTPPGAERLRLMGHTGIVNSASFSADGGRVVTASRDRTALVWDARTGQEIAALRGHEDIVLSASFSADGGRVVTASDDRTARVWDARTGQEIAVLRGHEALVLSASFSADGARVVTASDDHTARLWDPATGQEIAVLRGHEGKVWSASFSPDGARIVIASDDRTARLWDARTGQEIAVLRGHEASVRSASFSPDGARIVTASDDHTARLWDRATGQEIAVLRGHEGKVWSASFSPDGVRVVTASRDNSARLWNTITGQEIAVLCGHEFSMVDALTGNRASLGIASFSSDGTRVVTSGDRTARLWDATTGRELTVLRGHDRAVYNACFSPDGAQILTASGDKTARLWDTVAGQTAAALGSQDSAMASASYSGDGSRIVTCSDEGIARLWNAATGMEMAALRGHEKPVRRACFSPDGTRILTSGGDAARLWDGTTGEEIAMLRAHDECVYDATFSPNGERIVTVSSDHTARVWSATDRQEIATLPHGEFRLDSAFFSSDSTRILTASDDCALLWDASSVRLIAVLSGDELFSTLRVRFSPTGSRMVTISGGNIARLRDSASGEELAVLRGHEGRIQSASFSADGGRVVTASDDRTARVWDAYTGQEIALLRGHEGNVMSASFSADGGRVVTASNDRTARMWDARTGQEIARMTLDAAVTALDVCGGAIALGDALGRVHVFDAEEFLTARGSGGG